MKTQTQGQGKEDDEEGRLAMLVIILLVTLVVGVIIYKVWQGGGSWDVAADIRALHTETRQGSYQTAIEAPATDIRMTWEDYRQAKEHLPSESCGEWINKKTGKTECLLGLPPAERIKEFIPQDAASQNLYNTYIAQGKTAEESMELVLKASLATQYSK